MSRKRRSKNFVDTEVQGALVRRLLAHWALFMLAAACLAVILTWMNNPFAETIGKTLVDAVERFGPMLIALACLAPVYVYDSMKLSNRFSGPVTRLRQATKQLADGESPERLEFRGSDFWKDLATDFNRVSQRLSEHEVRDHAPVEA